MAAMDTVCVTGGTGFIASWIVKKLLERGYNIKATVRNPGDLSKTGHLWALPFATERLQLVKANLLEEESFREAVSGCVAVIHTASPVMLDSVEDPQTQLLDPALKGTLSVLKAVAATPGIKRVVLTSSMAAVAYKENRLTTKKWTEEHWSSEDYCKENKFWYQLSKTVAEKAAWEFAEKNGIDLVVINPAMVLGKMLQPNVNDTMDVVLKFMTGESKDYPNRSVGWVHVEDVAEAHVLAMEKPEAKGRHLCVASYVHYKELTVWLRHIDPTAPITDKCAKADDEELVMTPLVDNSKLRSLGVQFRNIEDILRDAVTSLKEKGFVPKSSST
eukprot:TRINITY_DN7359_c0_g1_i1.p1 TRINITY_DN7359_c0_g1~~TRINITY_DN7359_c0_g1_i1.p1  ORF type:complete len:331 (-),score=66.62 TRINITY_DN7359_c0_g1_i1:1010-2002(-)